MTTGDEATASDCLFVLKVAVGSEGCDACICDADGSGGVVASDALLCLRSAVGQAVVLACQPCSGTTHKDDFIGDPPLIVVDPPAPAGGGQTAVRVSVEGATQISLSFDGAGCGGLFDIVTPSDNVEVVEAAGVFGACRITAAVTVGDETVEGFARFEVVPVDLVLPAFEVLGGFFVPGDIPAAVGDAPQIAEIVAPPSIINGGGVELRIQLDDPGAAANVSQVLVEVPDHPDFQGHFTVPAELDGDDIVVKIQLDREVGQEGATLRENAAWRMQELEAGELIDVVLALRDNVGNISPTLIKQLALALVSTADVQISLSWDTVTDLDLYLVEPSGEEIYWQHKESAAGGKLNLDSPPTECGTGGNNENITYPGVKPPRGEYIVRVNFYDNCGGKPARYTVTRTVCGKTQVFTGSFTPEEAKFGEAGAGRVITRFNVDCDYRVRGKATYEDFPQTILGLSPVSRMLPIRFARVAVVRDSDAEVLAFDSTKQDGTFDISFKNDGEPGYGLVVGALRFDLNHAQEVVTGDEDLYQHAGPLVFDETADPDKRDVVLDVAYADNPGAAAAFNIFDVGVEAATFVARVAGPLPPLSWVWDRGQQGLCADKVTCFLPDRVGPDSGGQISVLSLRDDPDEHDDLVLLREYGRFFQHAYSRSDGAGGKHGVDLQLAPATAWSEGSATFFANAVEGSGLYLDTDGNGDLREAWYLEFLPDEVPLGTHPRTLAGKLSEALVAAMLWDLADDSPDELFDTVDREAGVFAAMRYLGSPAFQDRGAVGADMVDFLDGWSCKGLNARGDFSSGVEGIVSSLHFFPYDFAEMTPCP